LSLPRTALASAALVMLLVSACAGRREPSARPVGGGASAGLYKVRLAGGPGERARRFRLLLYAELPDRLHGEVVSPLGRTELIADGGGGRIYVQFVRDRVAFAGVADAEVIHDLLGIRLSLEELVRGLLMGELAGAEIELRREPAAGGALPERLEIQAPPRSVVMQLKRRQALAVDPRSLGTGEPPPGIEVRPLERLDPDMLPGVEVEEAS